MVLMEISFKLPGSAILHSAAEARGFDMMNFLRLRLATSVTLGGRPKGEVGEAGEVGKLGEGDEGEEGLFMRRRAAVKRLIVD